MEFGEMKRNTSNWSNFCMLLRRVGLTASAGLSCSSSVGTARMQQVNDNGAMSKLAPRGLRDDAL